MTIEQMLTLITLPPPAVLAQAYAPILAVVKRIKDEGLSEKDADYIETWVNEGIASSMFVLSSYYIVPVPIILTTGQAQDCVDDEGCAYKEAAEEALEGYETLVGTTAVTVPGLVLYNIYAYLPEMPREQGERSNPYTLMTTVLHEFFHHLVFSRTPKEQHAQLLNEPTLATLENWAQVKSNDCLAILKNYIE